MEALFWMMPAMLCFGVAGLGGLVWAARKGQFEDLEIEKYRLLLDDERSPEGAGAGERAPEPLSAWPGRGGGRPPRSRRP